MILRRERERPGGVVGFASEETLLREGGANVGGGAEPARRELVELRAVLVRFAQHVQCRLEIVDPDAHLVVAELFDQRRELLTIELGRVVQTECVAVSFLEMADEVTAERRGPCDPAFEEREPQFREAGHYATEQQRATQRLARGAERSDVVRDIARRRRAAAPTHAGGVERGRHVELHEAAPQRVVVVRAVEAEGIDPACTPRQVLARDRAVHEAGAHDRAQPECLDRVLEHLDRLVGRVRGHDGNRLEPVPETGVRLRVIGVERACGRDAQVGVVEAHHGESVGGVADGDVDAEFVEPFVQERREHRAGAVVRVLAGQSPPRDAEQPERALGVDVETRA